MSGHEQFPDHSAKIPDDMPGGDRWDKRGMPMAYLAGVPAGGRVIRHDPAERETALRRPVSMGRFVFRVVAMVVYLAMVIGAITLLFIILERL